MKTKVTIFTGSRSEYGLLKWLIQDIHNDNDLNLQLMVSGSHLSIEFGRTIDEIKHDGFRINEKVEMLLSSDTAVGTAKSLGLGVIGYADALKRLSPDIIIILGDRFEALAVAQTAMILRIPILHIHGGEITEGAYDDSIRHAITKMSTYHATSSNEHKKRVIQLGEDPKRVFNVGALGLECLKRDKFLSLTELSKSLNFKLQKPFLIFTYHSETLISNRSLIGCANALKALDYFQDLQVLITYPNQDDGGRKIINLLKDYQNKNTDRVAIFKSLGQLRYLSALRHSAGIIGNSSSGIIEAPSLKIPTINIGNRQKGRLAAKSVTHVKQNVQAIKNAIKDILDNGQFKNFSNPYSSGSSSRKIISIIKKADKKTIKRFYDV